MGACNWLCTNGCSYPGEVIATEPSGEQVIPVRFPAEPALTAAGNVCATLVPNGMRLRVEARPNPGFAFIHWASPPPNELHWGPCPCEGSTELICSFVVEERVYCGAVYTKG